MPEIKNVSDRNEIKRLTNEFLAQCTNQLKLNKPVKYMFRIVKANEIAVSNTNVGVEFKQDLIPDMLADVSEIITKDVKHIYVSITPQLYYY